MIVKTEQRFCRWCGKPLVDEQKVACCRDHANWLQQKGTWVKCAKAGCKRKVYVRPCENPSKPHYHSPDCYAARHEPVNAKCTVCGAPVTRKYSHDKKAIKSRWGACCSLECRGLLGFYAMLVKRHGIEYLADRLRAEAVGYVEKFDGSCSYTSAQLAAVMDVMTALAARVTQVVLPRTMVQQDAVSTIPGQD